MKKLYAPWRGKYIIDKARNRKDKTGCPFCTAFESANDQEHYILKRTEHAVVMLNLYPYNAGHLLILPKSHEKDLYALGQDTQNDLMSLISEANKVLEEVLNPEGINIGLNLGKAGGGGIPSHLHFHLLPRWNGDTSFLPLLSDTTVVSVDLDEIYALLKERYDQL